MKSILSITILIFSQISWGHEAQKGRFHVSLGPFVYEPQIAVSPNYRVPNTPFGVGVLTEGNFNSSQGLEFGMFFLKSYYLIERDLIMSLEAIQRVAISTVFRTWIHPQFSFAFGVFSSYSMGDPKVIYSSNGDYGVSKSSANDVVEYGLDSSFQFEFFKQLTHLGIFDLRYHWSFTGKEKEAGNNLIMLVMYKWRVQ